jgi:O-antigen ligase
LALFAAAVAFLLPVVFSPSVQATFWTPAAALCLVIAGVGAPRLVRLARQDTAARAACAFVVVAFVSALLASNRTLSFFGLYVWGTGWLFVVCLASAWAIGRSTSRRGAELIERAIVAAAALNAAVAILEMAFDLTTLQLGKFGGRAIGVLGNPIHLGGFVGAAIVLLGTRFRRRPARWAIAPVLFGAAVQVSGSRAGFAIILAGTAWIAVHSSRRLGMAFAALVLVGLFVGGAVADAGGGTSVSNRIQGTAAGGGLRSRTETWKAAVSSVPDHSLIGIGPGLFRDATAPRRTVAMAHAEAADTLLVDAHNVFVEYVTTTGVLGLLAFAIWIVLAARVARGPLWWFTLLLAVNHLVEPQNVRTTPVLFLALGAAASVDGLRSLPRIRFEDVARVCTTLVAVVAASTLLLGDFHLEQGRLDFVHGHARSALRLLPRWAEPALLEGRIYLFDERIHRRPEDRAAALRWFRVAAERDAGNPLTWNTLAENLLAAGQFSDAHRAFVHALHANPTGTRTLNGLAHVALARGDTASALRWFQRSLVMNPDQRGVHRELDALRGGP